jgi:CheY-like chemotaxis protein
MAFFQLPGMGLQVLLAEGDAVNTAFMTVLLETEGHQVQAARNGPSALQLAQADPPDVVLLAIHLPGMDGWEVARRLCQQAAQKKPFCIAITNDGTAVDRRRSEDAGIDLHLEKPVDLDFLRKLLRRFQRIILPSEAVPEAAADAGTRPHNRDSPRAFPSIHSQGPVSPAAGSAHARNDPS